MHTLPELQKMFGRALLTGDEAALSALEAEVAQDQLPPRERLAVYRNNVLASLTDVLRQTFPVVCRLVGDPFFAFAAREFIAAHPPSRPMLSAYGEAFPAFLAAFPPSRDLVYLADTAQLEWLMNAALYAADTTTVSPSCLSDVAADAAGGLVFRFHPACGYLASPWPVDRIWRANQPDAQDPTVDLDSGGVRLEVSRRDDGVVFRALDEAAFVFRTSLSQGAPFGIALERALTARPEFPAADALTDLFASGLVVEVGQSSSA